MVKQIPLTQGKVALVSDEDYESLNQFKWHTTKSNNRIYAGRYMRDGNCKRFYIRMHQVVSGIKAPDHIDGDGLNNQRSNLRPATSSQNMANRQNTYVNTSSKYKGVSWNRFRSKWTASISVNNKRIWLGAFHAEEEAAHAYDAAAIKYFGEFAKPNFR